MQQPCPILHSSTCQPPALWDHHFAKGSTA